MKCHTDEKEKQSHGV